MAENTERSHDLTAEWKIIQGWVSPETSSAIQPLQSENSTAQSNKLGGNTRACFYSAAPVPAHDFTQNHFCTSPTVPLSPIPAITRARSLLLLHNILFGEFDLAFWLKLWSGSN